MRYRQAHDRAAASASEHVLGRDRRDGQPSRGRIPYTAWMHIKTAVIVFLIALPLMAANQVHELAANDSKWSGQMRPGGSLQVRGGLGDIDVVASDHDAIVVEVKRGAEGSVIPRIIVVEMDNGVAVCGDWTTAAGQQSRCGSEKGMLASSRL